MKYTFSKEQWAELVKLAQKEFRCGEFSAITRMMEVGLNTPFIVRSGKLVTQDGTDPTTIEVELDPEAALDNPRFRARKQKVEKLLKKAAEVAVVAEHKPLLGTGGVQQKLPFDTSKDWDLRSGILALQAQVGGMRLLQNRLDGYGNVLQTTKAVVDQLRLEMCAVTQRVDLLTTEFEELTKKLTRKGILADGYNASIEQIFSRIYAVEHATKELSRALREKKAIDSRIDNVKSVGQPLG